MKGQILVAGAAIVLVAACGSPQSTPSAKDSTPHVDISRGETLTEETQVRNNCLMFEPLTTNYEPPSNVVVLFGLETCDGQPKPGISAEQFIIKEDGEVISLFESGQAILPSEMGFRLGAILVLDMSGSIILSGNLELLKSAATEFIAKLDDTHEISVYTFDGRKNLQALLAPEGGTLVQAVEDLSFPECTSKEDCPAELPVCHKSGATGFCVGDPSTNLNGAVLAGISLLDDQAQQTPETTIFAGSLVVFTDGTDQAGIVSSAQAAEQVASSEHTVFSIGLGGEVDKVQLQAIGKDGTTIADNAEEISSAFDGIAQLIGDRASRFYVLGYCSPKRAGEHTLSLTVEGYSGAPLTYPFNAEGFEAGCDASMIADPCGQTHCGTGKMGLLCGECAADEQCEEGVCHKIGCQPSCNGKSCGDDGCGGYCGECSNGEYCHEGA